MPIPEDFVFRWLLVSQGYSIVDEDIAALDKITTKVSYKAAKFDLTCYVSGKNHYVVLYTN